MSYLRDYIILFAKTGDVDVLKKIYKLRGKYGVSLAAKMISVPRSVLNAKLGINNPNREIAREAKKNCGIRISNIYEGR
jgi:hypothetical protein